MKETIKAKRVWAVMKKIAVVGMVVPGMVVSSVGALGFLGVPVAQAVTEQACSTATLTSGVNTQTAGFIDTTDPSATPLDPTLYSHGSFVGSTATQTVIPPWIDPSTDANFIGSGAVWASTDATWPGGTGNTEGDSTHDQWRLFQDGFTLPAGATVNSADLWYTGDNAVAVYQNGTFLERTGGAIDDVFGPVPGALPFVFSSVFHTTLTPSIGTNTLNFVVRNWGGDFHPNPTGLLYKAVVNYCVPIAPSTVKVTLVKYLDGQPATAASANSVSFPMTATWNAANIGAGSGGFSLGPVGFNNPNPYQATTADMTAGASYSAVENLPTTCDAGNPYALVGYSTGDTLEGAAGASVSAEAPSFTQLAGDKFIVVRNKTCSPAVLLKVHILKYLDGAKADATSAAGYQFPMTATWQTANLDGGVSTSGNYVLGNNHGGAPDLYGADTAPMAAPADYTTSEITSDIDGTSKVVPIGGACVPGGFRLAGYRSSAVSFDDAALQPTTPTAPVFTGLSSDRYVLVLNTTCPTTGSLIVNKAAIGGNGTFSFTGNGGIGGFSITTVLGAGSATFTGLAQGTYNVTETAQDGWAVTGNTCLQAAVTAGATSTCTITNTKLGEISGTKYEDTRKDGDDERDDDGHGHRGLPGWTIYLDANNNGRLDEGESSMVTDASGKYDFKNLLPGTYHVREVMQDGWTQVYPKTGEHNISLAAGQVAKEKDFRNFRNGSISGMKFYDKDGDRKEDHGETGLANWTIKLMKNNNVVATTLTDGNGNYSFTNVGPGTYKVREVQQPGWQQTTTNPPDVHMFSGEARTGVNFGNQQLKDIVHGHGNNRADDE